MPKKENISKVLVIGSGPIVIGQAAEFDYAGTQGCLALKEEGYEVVLINNNPATIMTDEQFADHVYFEPLTVKSIEEIIQKECPDSLLATLGGQTGLNLAFELYNQGILQKYGVEVLGTPIESIVKGEDREAFRALMNELKEPVPKSEIVSTVEEALEFARGHGYPLIVRPAYTLGGSGGGFADNDNELVSFVTNGLAASPIHQCLLEKSIAGFKEIEYEVMRDGNDTCITICNMENIDPVGVHTGDSIVTAPSQTLTDSEYHMLRKTSLKIIRALGIVGGCNIQFALDPDSRQYYLIEVNPRVSRSSALASKATGYPIAKIAAKLGLGYGLHELKNPVTGNTYASFEPALDYAVVKLPRWPFDKFPKADRKLGTQMKATGEVMAIERNFGSAVQKAIRSLELNIDGLVYPAIKQLDDQAVWELVTTASDRRLFAIFELLRRGVEVSEIHEKTKISGFFLSHFHSLIKLENEAKQVSISDVTPSLLLKLKENGFSDHWLANIWETGLFEVRELRKKCNIIPSYKMVDTCAAEFAASTAYYYSSWRGESDVEIHSERKKVLVLGAGPIRIGQGVEFDYCSVHAVSAFKEAGVETVLINNNPETVSTDYTLADRLYFEPLALEDVLNVIEFEDIDEVNVQFGGQTAISLVEGLEEAGVSVLGVTQSAINRLEDRDAFYNFLNTINVPHIPGLTAHSHEELFEKANEVGFPVLLRPSYVIGGRGMVILQSPQELDHYLNQPGIEISYPILIDAYVPGTEVEVDVVTDGKNIFIPAVLEHVEKAGVHSGDSTAVTPPYTLSEKIKGTVVSYTEKIAQGMDFKGIFNIQFVVFGKHVYVLEINPRASRTVPMLSKIAGVDLCDLAVKVLLGKTLEEVGFNGLLPDRSYYSVKMPVFSTSKLPGVDPLIGPEMQSTGELIAIDRSLESAIHKGLCWKEGFTHNWDSAGAVFCDIGSDDVAVFEKIVSCLRNHKVEFVTDCRDTAESLGLDLIDFTSWMKTEKGTMLISIPKKGVQSGIEKRLLAQTHRLQVISDWDQFHLLLMGETAGEEHTKSIGEWIKQGERSPVKK